MKNKILIWTSIILTATILILISITTIVYFNNKNIIFDDILFRVDTVDNESQWEAQTNLTYRNGNWEKTSLKISEYSNVNYESSYEYYQGIVSDQKLYKSSKNKREQIFDLSEIDTNSNENYNGGTWSNHHELFINDDYAVLLLSKDDFQNAGSVDNDSILVLENNKGKYEQEYFIDLLDLFGWKEDDLISEGIFKIIYSPMPELIGMEPNETTDFLHINAFDVNKKTKRMFLSSRTLNAIFCINYSTGIPELEFVLSNPSTYKYSLSNSSGNPIIKTNDETAIDYMNGYASNPSYIPETNINWIGKTLDYEVDGVTYSSEENKWNLSEKYLFSGQHYVRSLNSMFEETGIYKDYDDTKEYISIYDNHTIENTLLSNQRYTSGGIQNYTENGKLVDGSFYTGDHDYSMKNKLSFVKVFEIDPENTVAKLIYNKEVPHSRITSQAQFGVLGGELYIYGVAGYPLINNDNYFSPYLYKVNDFDSILNNDEENIEVLYQEDIYGGSGYRLVPIFHDFDKVKLGWGLYY